MQILAHEILKLSVTGGEDNRFLHPLFLILLFKHFLQSTAHNRTLDWLDLQLFHIEVVMVLSQIIFTTVSENMVSFLCFQHTKSNSAICIVTHSKRHSFLRRA